jgi:hypothetical protein
MIHETSSLKVLAYQPGLNKVQEAVVSSHFMHRFGADERLNNYSEGEIRRRSLSIGTDAVLETLLPVLVDASRRFALDRAAQARQRARENFAEYGLARPEFAGPPQFIAEAMFDRQFSRGSRKNYSKQLLSAQVAAAIESGAPVRMAIPALPFKIASPLKCRGQLPDLAEVNFLLDLYEIALTVEILYGETAGATGAGRLAEFAVVSDGSRFSALVGESAAVVRRYRRGLAEWTERLGIDDYVTIHDYGDLLSERLPAAARARKAAIAKAAAADYAAVMCPVFDPDDMERSLRRAAEVEPDPERANPEGRFVSLLKSLVYTITYRALGRVHAPRSAAYGSLYREITAHLFTPYPAPSPDVPDLPAPKDGEGEGLALPDSAKEALRREMLREAWDATILYMAEIKSDRDLDEDPILTCLPGHIRWTIHAKRGQIAVAVPTVAGLTVQAWAGSAVFKRAKGGGLKLCTLPVVALEGGGAVPVGVDDPQAVLGLGDQPLFYIYPDVAFEGIGDFLGQLATSLDRRRAW